MILMKKFIQHFLPFSLLLLLGFFVTSSSAQDIEALKKGVVKITATTFKGNTKVGTGFIVRQEKDAVYIVTVTHVVDEDPELNVEFFTLQHRQYSARVINVDWEDPNGLAVLLVEGPIPSGLSVLNLTSSVPVIDGDPVTTIGFPLLSSVDWAVNKGNIVGRKGSSIIFSGATEEGNSGGPLLKEGQVIGVVTKVIGKLAYAIPTSIVELTLEGWGVEVLEDGTDGVVSTPGRAKLPNIFENVRSPGIWFERAQYYRRSDSELPRKTKRSEGDEIVLRRRYFSADNNLDGPFGQGWHYSFESRIEVNLSSVGKIVYWDESGELIVFQPMQPETYVVELLKSYLPNVSLRTPLSEVFEAEERMSDFFLSKLSKEKEIRYLGVGLNVAELRFLGEHLQIRVPGGISYLFDRKGRLHWIKRPSQPDIEIRYDPRNPNRVVRVSAEMDKAHFIDFEYNAYEQIRLATYEDGTRYEYAYKNGCLVGVTTDSTILISYGYDDDNHLDRVEEAGAPEPLIIRYSYNRRTELIRGSERIKWEFDDHPYRPPRVVTIRWREQAEPDSIEFIFDKVNESLIMKDPKWNAPKVYHLTACSCNPLEVMQLDDTTRYLYNDLGQIKRIIMSSGETIDVEYHPEFFKVTSVIKRVGADSIISEQNKFRYDKKGQLYEAIDNEGQLVHIAYNQQGLVKMVKGDWDDKEYYFTYNEISKPASVRVPGLGVFLFDYDYRGNFLRFEQDKEHALLRISPSEILIPLQKVMKVIEPAYSFPIDRDFTKIEATL